MRGRGVVASRLEMAVGERLPEEIARRGESAAAGNRVAARCPPQRRRRPWGGQTRACGGTHGQTGRPQAQRRDQGSTESSRLGIACAGPVQQAVHRGGAVRARAATPCRSRPPRRGRRASGPPASNHNATRTLSPCPTMGEPEPSPRRSGRADSVPVSTRTRGRCRPRSPSDDPRPPRPSLQGTRPTASSLSSLRPRRRTLTGAASARSACASSERSESLALAGVGALSGRAGLTVRCVLGPTG